MNAVTWTAPVVPKYANKLTIHNEESGANDIKIRTDAADSGTEFPPMPAGTWKEQGPLQDQAFEIGATPFAYLSVSGSFEIVLEWQLVRGK